MSEVSNPRAKPAVPWRGRRRVEDAKTSFISVRCTAGERVLIDEASAQAGLSVGAYLRTLALGKPGPRARRRPPIERAVLARLLGELGKIGSNINQIAHAYNGRGRVPALEELKALRDEVGRIRKALMTALGRDH
jgi:hypothetical protein